ncbi:MAG TPA: heme exporter protein CcmB [Longimicrobiaceae bacterium]|nr:heme exporter protein CcmB [Longimicrobiaceae bacterium]
MTFVRQVLTVASKDLVLELRSRERLVSMLTFALLIAVVFSFALDPTVRSRDIAGAMIWITIFFAGMLGLGRSFGLEREQDTLTGVLLAPIDRGAFYLGKVTANLVLLLIVDIVLVPVYGLFFQIDLWGQIGGLAVVVGLASAGFVALGTLFSAMAAHSRLGESLLPILLLPLLIPVVFFSARSTQLLITGRPISDVAGSIRVLLAFDLIFLIVCTMVFESVVEE